MKIQDVLLIVLWAFYVLETIGAVIVRGDWFYISLVAVIFIPIIILLKK